MAGDKETRKRKGKRERFERYRRSERNFSEVEERVRLFKATGGMHVVGVFGSSRREI